MALPLLLAPSAPAAGAAPPQAAAAAAAQATSRFDPAQLGPRTESVHVQSYARVVYVSRETGSDATGDGTAKKPWATPQHALSAIADAAGPKNKCAVFVAAGTYDDSTLRLKPHVELFGGFDPATWKRNVTARASVLSGLGARRVVIGADDARLDGFTLREGLSTGPGGAVLCDGTSPVLSNNVIVDNASAEPAGNFSDMMHQVGNDGGAIACLNGASPTIANNLLARNHTGVGNGGAIACRNYSNPTIVNNVLCGNVAGRSDRDKSRSSNGGAISCSTSSRAVIRNNVVAGNRVTPTSNSDAGGIYCEYDSSAEIAHNWIVGNFAEDDGGGIYVMKSSEPVIDSNVIAGNTGGGAIRLSKDGRARIHNNVVFGNDTGDMNCVYSWMVLTNNTVVDNAGGSVGYENQTPYFTAPVIANNIFYGNRLTEVRLSGNGAMPTVSHCLVRGGFAGEGNLDQPPLFVDDGQRGTVEKLTFDAGAMTTAVTVADDLREPRSLAGRVVRIGRRWAVIKSAERRGLTVWGDALPEDPAQARAEYAHSKHKPPADDAAAPLNEFEIAKTYRLRPESPCVDAGADVDAPKLDIDGDPRPTGRAIDIGADEIPAAQAANAAK
jgi:hypothetical protein